MKTETTKARLTLLILFVALGVCIHFSYADFRDGVGSGKFIESTVTSATPNERGSAGSVHTPIVASLPGVTASATTHAFTSGTAAISVNTASSITTAFDLTEVRANFSAASSTQTLVLWVDSGAGTEFDVTLLSSAVSTTATIFRPTSPVPFRSADAFRADYGNVNSDTVGIEYITVQP